ncbi:MAG: hypothetical protein KatS3mg019_2590 [Fimbriimonadales bacterium]|nr:MAG: hypothetical protein KatS3mg019_2590 [Fimbriimonadales bacterium]
MRRLGLRERLLLFYALMALLPVALSGMVLYNYLEGQAIDASVQFQRGMQDELRHYQSRLEQGATQTLETTRRQMRAQASEQLQQLGARAQTEQATLLRETVRALQTTTGDALHQAEQQTLHHLDQTLERVEREVQRAQTQSLQRLQQTTADATREALQALTLQHLTQLSLQLSRQVESLLRNYAAQLTLIAQQPAIQSGEAQQSRWILQALQDREPAYVYLCLVDAHGAPHLELGDSIDDGMLIALERGQLWARLQETQDSVWGEARLHRVDGRLRPLIPMMTPIRRMGAQQVGAVFALVSPEELSTVTRLGRVGERGTVILAQQDGLILAHTDPTRVGQTEPRLRTLLETLRQPQSMLTRTDEGEWLIAAAPIRQISAALIIAQPTEEAFQLATRLQQDLQQSFQAQQTQTRLALTLARQTAQHQFNQQTQQQQAQVRRRLQAAERDSLAQSLTALENLNRAQQQAVARTIDASLERTQQALREGLTTRLREASHRALQRLEEITVAMREAIQQQLRDSFVLALGSVALCMALGALLLHRFLVRPLRILVRTTHAIAAGDLTQRVQLPQRGIPDLDDLADSFNQMVDAVQKAEAQLIQSSKLASLGTLASGVAHELNQPLAIIRAIAQQNLETLNDSPTPLLIQQLREDLQIIHRQTVRMSQIIQHLRAFSRKPREEFEPVNLNEVAQNALILLREQLRQRGIELVEAYEPALPPVLGEANSLEQIAINLLTNARDALEGRDGGQITISTGLYDDGKRLYAELRVRDNGPGVPPDIRPQIFDPFFTTKDPNKGTGLGLAISQEIAQKHGGVLLLGDVEQGAEFILRVPVAQAQREAA